jgi:hypothetical protein
MVAQTTRQQQKRPTTSTEMVIELISELIGQLPSYKNFAPVASPIVYEHPGKNILTEIFEPDVDHGINCHRIGCSCTPISVCNENDRIREMQFREISSRSYRNQWRRARKKELLRKQMQEELA